MGGTAMPSFESQAKSGSSSSHACGIANRPISAHNRTMMRTYRRHLRSVTPLLCSSGSDSLAAVAARLDVCRT
jgi:hypothetical protein